MNILGSLNMDTSEDLTFPFWAMSGIAEQFASLYDQYFESAKQYFYFAFLTMLSHSISSKVIITNSEIDIQARLYTLLLGESADARKSTAITQIHKFWQYCEIPVNDCWGANSAEGLEDMMKDMNNTILMYDEFSSFIMKARIESSVLREMVNQLFDRNKYEGRTKHNKIGLNDVHLTLLAATTDETYETLFDDSFTRIGFTNRLLLIPGDNNNKEFHRVPKIPEKDKDAIKTQLIDIIDNAGDMSISPNADKVWKSWYGARRKDEFSKRLDEYLMRLAVLIALSDKKYNIDDVTIRKAIAIVDWQYKVRTTFLPNEGIDKIGQMENRIKHVLKRHGSMSYAKLKNKCKAFRYSSWIFKTAISNNLLEGEITEKNGQYQMPLNAK